MTPERVDTDALLHFAQLHAPSGYTVSSFADLADGAVLLGVLRAVFPALPAAGSSNAVADDPWVALHAAAARLGLPSGLLSREAFEASCDGFEERSPPDSSERREGAFSCIAALYFLAHIVAAPQAIITFDAALRPDVAAFLESPRAVAALVAGGALPVSVLAVTADANSGAPAPIGPAAGALSLPAARRLELDAATPKAPSNPLATPKVVAAAIGHADTVMSAAATSGLRSCPAGPATPGSAVARSIRRVRRALDAYGAMVEAAVGSPEAAADSNHEAIRAVALRELDRIEDGVFAPRTGATPAATATPASGSPPQIGPVELHTDSEGHSATVATDAAAAAAAEVAAVRAYYDAELAERDAQASALWTELAAMTAGIDALFDRLQEFVPSSVLDEQRGVFYEQLSAARNARSPSRS